MGKGKLTPKEIQDERESYFKDLFGDDYVPTDELIRIAEQTPKRRKGGFYYGAKRRNFRRASKLRLH